MSWLAFSHQCQAQSNVSEVTNPSHADVTVYSLALAGKEIAKILVVKERLVNIVVK